MEGRQSVVEISKSMPPPNPITQLQTRFKASPVDATVVTFIKSAAEGAVVGAILGTLASFVPSFLPPTLQAGLNPQARSPSWGALVRGHDKKFPFLWCVNDAIFGFMRRTEGVDALQTSMVAAFGSGAIFSLVTGFGGPNKMTNVVRSGLFSALFQGGIFQLQESICPPLDHMLYSGARAEDKYYARTRSLLTSLGLQNYVKDFKKGLLTDKTLPLLTDSALREVNIPAGPRLLILDHIQRDPELKRGRDML